MKTIHEQVDEIIGQGGDIMEFQVTITTTEVFFVRSETAKEAGGLVLSGTVHPASSTVMMDVCDPESEPLESE